MDIEQFNCLKPSVKNMTSLLSFSRVQWTSCGGYFTTPFRKGIMTHSIETANRGEPQLLLTDIKYSISWLVSPEKYTGCKCQAGFAQVLIAYSMTGIIYLFLYRRYIAEERERKYEFKKCKRVNNKKTGPWTKRKWFWTKNYTNGQKDGANVLPIFSLGVFFLSSGFKFCQWPLFLSSLAWFLTMIILIYIHGCCVFVLEWLSCFCPWLSCFCPWALSLSPWASSFCP